MEKCDFTAPVAFRFSLVAMLAVPVLISAGCMTKQTALPWDDSTFENPMIVKSVEYDRYGRPLFQSVLDNRPDSPGDRFTLVFSNNLYPVFSVDVAVSRRHVDAARPFRTLYAWTGKGFKTGADISENLLEGYARGLDENRIKGKFESHVVAVAAIVVVPVTVGATTGFVIGVAAGARDAIKELRKAVINRQEQITAVTRYEYDALHRLTAMRMFSPDFKTEVVRTTFFYRADEETPFRTVVYSLVENMERIIEATE